MTAVCRMAGHILRRVVWRATAAAAVRGRGESAPIFDAAVRLVRALPRPALDRVVLLQMPFWSDLARTTLAFRRGEVFEYGVVVGVEGPRVVVHPSMSIFAQQESRST